MVPLLKVSNIASSTMSDDSRFYVTVQLSGYMVIWLHSLGCWAVLSHWAVSDEVRHKCVIVCAILGILQSTLIYFHTLSLTGGVAVCTVTTSGTCRFAIT